MYNPVMSGKEGEIGLPVDNSAFAMVPYEDTSSLNDLESFVSSLDEITPPSRIEVLSQQFEANYSEHLVHQRRVLQPRPSKQEDPEGHRQWIESHNHLRTLAQQDLPTASIVKRLETPLHERINRNAPKKTRINKRGDEIDEYGRGLWLKLDNEEEEFAEWEREARRAEGTEVPINRIETQEIVGALALDASRTGEHLDILDVLYDTRDGGEVYLADGTQLFIDPDPDLQQKYAKEAAEVDQEVQELRDVQMRYIHLLPSADQLEWRRKNKIPDTSESDSTLV